MVRDPFPAGVVPRAMFDPVAGKALAYIPAANRPPADPTGTPPLFGLDNIADPGGSTQERYNKNLMVNLTSTFTPTLLNELRVSVTRQYLLSSPTGYRKNAPAAIGFPATPADVRDYYAFFVQDDWKITRRLTLNLGLR